MVAIACGLGIVDLDPVLNHFEDLVVWIGELPLSLRFRIALSIGWELNLSIKTRSRSAVNTDVNTDDSSSAASSVLIAAFVRHPLACKHYGCGTFALALPCVANGF